MLILGDLPLHQHIDWLKEIKKGIIMRVKSQKKDLQREKR